MACQNAGCGAAGVIAKALTLLVLGVGVGAAHSVMQPISLRMTPTAPTSVDLPGGAGSPAGQTPDAGTPDAGAQGEEGAGDTGATPAGAAADPEGGAGREPVAATEQIVLEQYLSLDITRRLWESGVVQFIDARHRDEFVAGHIPRAILMDPDDMYAARMPEGLDFLDPEAITVIYCGGGDCDASENAGRFLQQMGFTQLHIFRDGFPAWDDAGLPVNIGEPLSSTPRPARGGAGAPPNSGGGR